MNVISIRAQNIAAHTINAVWECNVLFFVFVFLPCHRCYLQRIFSSSAFIVSLWYFRCIHVRFFYLRRSTSCDNFANIFCTLCNARDCNSRFTLENFNNSHSTEKKIDKIDGTPTKMETCTDWRRCQWLWLDSIYSTLRRHRRRTTTHF